MLEADLRLRDFEVLWNISATAAEKTFPTGGFDVVLTDLRMPELDGVAFCRRLVALRPDVPVIVMTAFGSLETAMQAMRAGAYDFVTKPIDLDALELALRRAVKHRELQEQISVLSRAVAEHPRIESLQGECSAMLRLSRMIARVAETQAAVLITGESGSGKEVVARAIHDHSPRAGRPFVAVNCAAIPDTLMESELFGHEKGAFTDARSQRRGLFQQADGGTLFLDEIGELALALQPKLLRVLETGRFRPVGSEEEIAVDVRLVAATNRDLLTAIEEGRFRDDLYYRVNVIQLEVPPLRVRGSDILLLAKHFLSTFASRGGKPVTGITKPAAEKLLAYSWPGNVRELRNVMERAVALTDCDQLIVDDLPDKIRDFQSERLVLDGQDPDELVSLAEMERRYLLHVVRCVGANKAMAARILGLDRTTLYRKLKEYGEPPADKPSKSGDD